MLSVVDMGKTLYPFYDFGADFHKTIDRQFERLAKKIADGEKLPAAEARIKELEKQLDTVSRARDDNYRRAERLVEANIVSGKERNDALSALGKAQTALAEEAGKRAVAERSREAREADFRALKASVVPSYSDICGSHLPPTEIVIYGARYVHHTQLDIFKKDAAEAKAALGNCVATCFNGHALAGDDRISLFSFASQKKLEYVRGDLYAEKVRELEKSEETLQAERRALLCGFPAQLPDRIAPFCMATGLSVAYVRQGLYDQKLKELDLIDKILHASSKENAALKCQIQGYKWSIEQLEARVKHIGKELGEYKKHPLAGQANNPKRVSVVIGGGRHFVFYDPESVTALF